MNNDIASPLPTTVLGILVDQQLSAVTFVQDYVQLDFDGRRLTLNVWPEVSLAGVTFNEADPGYRDALCSLIGKKVRMVSETETEIVVIFADARIAIDLSEEIGIEHAIFEDTLTNAWAWW